MGEYIKMFECNMIIIVIISLLLICDCVIMTLTLILDRNYLCAINTVFIFILSALLLNAIIRTNPYPVFKLSGGEYEYFIENDYGPKRISEYIKLRDKKIDENKIEMIESILQNISEDNKIK